MGLHTVRTKPGQMVRERSVDGRFVALSRVPSTTCRTRGRRSRVLGVHLDGDDAAISFLVFEIYDVPHESSSISRSRRPRRGRRRGNLVSRARDLRRAAREFVDLVFSVVHPDGADAAISFLVFEIYDIPQMPGAPQPGRAHQRRAWHRFAETVLPLQQACFQGLDPAFSGSSSI